MMDVMRSNFNLKPKLSRKKPLMFQGFPKASHREAKTRRPSEPQPLRVEVLGFIGPRAP